MFRRRKPPEPPPSPNRHYQLAELAMTWRRAADRIAVSNLSVRDKALRITRAEIARTYLHAAHQLEQALKEEP